MFQGATGYFRAISVEDDAALQLYDPGAFDELVQALEAARSRLAIAVAADSKMTPLSQRRLYLETDARLRRCLRKLRARQWPGRSGHNDWIECLESLTRLARARLPAAADPTGCAPAWLKSSTGSKGEGKELRQFPSLETGTDARDIKSLDFAPC